jgi:hypothetical protein
MSEDIVERMRFWSKTRNDNPTAWNLDCETAADAIERLTAERDEARREICVMLEYATNNHRENHAKRWGWDCFKEDRK